jgi:sodium transport system permease protein
MKAWWTVFVKEARENARDRRAVFAALIYGPLIGPVLFAAMMSFVLGKQQEQQEKPLELPVIGAEQAPNFVNFLKQQGAIILPATADPEKEIREQNRSVILRIPPEFAKAWRAGEPAPVELLYDASRQQALPAFERARALIEGYGQLTGVLRLQVRGIDPKLVHAVAVRNHDLSTPVSRAGGFLAFMPYLLVLSAFIGGMYLAIDVTAGERERQSLEPLLITPVPRAAILAGKLAATTAYSLLSLLISVVAFSISLPFVPADALGFVLSVPPAMALRIALAIAPMAFLASSLQTIIASYARSFREAQTYLQFLMLLPAAPSILLAINPVKPDPWMWVAPLFSQSVLINALARGDAVSPAQIATSVAVTLLVAFALALVAVRLYQRERIALG